MTDTANLGLPFIETSQAQKHVTHNESLRILDALVMLSVKDRDLTAPPGAPAEGDRYLVKATGTGAFAGREDQVAHYADGGWTFYPPKAGWLAYIEDEGALVAWDGSAWDAVIAGGGGGGSGDVVGPASATLNRIAVFSNTSGKRIADGGAVISTDGTFAANSDAKVPTEKAVRTFVREKLAANRIYYVRTDGSNSNDGLSNTSGGAFLTINHAIAVVQALDLSIYNVLIQLADGTYNERVQVSGAFVGSGTVTIQGNTSTPTNVIVGDSSGNGIVATDGASIVVKYLQPRAQASGQCILANTKATIKFDHLVFPSVSGGAHLMAQTGGVIIAVGDYTIAGGAAYHASSQALFSSIRATGLTITITGTPAFSSSFVNGVQISGLQFTNNTYNGSATGVRYDIQNNSFLQINGATLPGNSAGTTATGGQVS
jgi:hypothetical protein